MYKQMLCPRPIPRILFDKLTVWGYSILSSQEPTSFLGKKSENPQWSMIETWEFEYVDGNFTENSLEFPLHDCYHGSSQIFKKTYKNIHEFMSSVHGLQPSSVKARHAAGPQVSPVCPLSKVTWLGNCSSCIFFERWELFKRAWSLEGRTQQNRTHI